MSQQNITGQAAIQKLKSLAESARICMMTTQLDARPVSARPMSLQEVDDQGILWFISSKESDKNHEIHQDCEVQLYFMNSGSSEYLSIYGSAKIYTDQASIDEHWSVMANAWFDGKTDPDVSIIGVAPKDVRYWDTKHGKLVDMALMAYSAISGEKTADGGVSGKLLVDRVA